MLLVSVSGIRGIAGVDLTAERAAAFAARFGRSRRGGTIVLGRDSRPSGEMLRHAVIAALLEAGCTVLDIGIVPTPSCGFAVRYFQAAGGVQVTASHNPLPWNGLKLFGPDGAVVDAASAGSPPAPDTLPAPPAVADVNTPSAASTGPDAAKANTPDPAHAHTANPAQSATPVWGQLRVPEDPLPVHLQAVLDAVPVAAIATGRFRVLVDGNGGAGGPPACLLLEQLGCEVVRHACEPTGQFEHDPEPTPDHLQTVAPWVAHNACAVGFALDPDADRLALIDEQGRCLSEELTLALAVEYRLREQPGPVVINQSTSRWVELTARRHGCPCYRCPVGEAHVVAHIRQQAAVIGGEGNGGVIDPHIGWVRDPFVAMAYILALLAQERRPLSAIVQDYWPPLAMLKTKWPLPRTHLDAAYAALTARWPHARADRQDGLRLETEEWWLHLRPSNTEPAVRLIVESPSEQRSHELLQMAQEAIRQAVPPAETGAYGGSIPAKSSVSPSE